MTVVARPVGPRVLVKPLGDDAHKTKAGLIVPVEAALAVRERRGMIVAVGKFVLDVTDDGVQYADMDVRVGQTVVYGQNSGMEVRLDLMEDGTLEDFIVLHMTEVLLVLEDEADVRERETASRDVAD